MIGDSEKSDIIPAKLLGIQTHHVMHVSETEKLIKDIGKVEQKTYYKRNLER